MSVTLGVLVRGKDRSTRWGLGAVTLINFFLSHQGLTLVEDMNGGGFLARANATIIAAGLSVGVYLFWNTLHVVLPGLRTLAHRLVVLALALLFGVPLIIAASAHPNATGIAGMAALNTAIDARIADFERATADRFEATNQLQGLLTDLGVMVERFEADAKDEEKHGVFSGKGGPGAVLTALTRIASQLAGMKAAIEKYQSDANALLESAQGDLATMRETAGKDLPASQRLKLVRNTADQLRGKLLKMDTRPLSASLSRLVSNLPGEVGGMPTKLSDDTRLAKSQADALARLGSQIGETTKKLAQLGEALAASSPADIPVFGAVTPMHAMAAQWRNYTSVWAIAILIDMAPLLPLLFLVLATNERTRGELAEEAMASLTVRELLLSEVVKSMLKGPAQDAASVRALVNALLGREDRK